MMLPLEKLSQGYIRSHDTIFFQFTVNYFKIKALWKEKDEPTIQILNSYSIEIKIMSPLNSVHECPWEHYSLWPYNGNNLNAYQLMNGKQRWYLHLGNTVRSQRGWSADACHGTTPVGPESWGHYVRGEKQSQRSHIGWLPLGEMSV